MPDRVRPHEYLAACGAHFAVWLFRRLPLERASALGGWLARRLGPLFSVHRLAARNLARAMPELDAPTRARILDGMWDNLGRVLAEYPHLGHMQQGPADAPGRIEVVGIEHLAGIHENGRPAIFFSAHYGNWELPGLAASWHGLALVQVYRAANNPLTENLLQRLREPVGGRHFPKGAEAARELIRALKRNESLGLMVDQKLNNGVAVPFFGRDAMTAPAIAEFALRFGCPVFPARAERLGGTRFRVTVEPPLTFTSTGDREADVYAALLQINRKLEDWIRDRPDHWFWVHRRWPKD
ncbi:lysophospholipid acyltransferase family protein [Ferrovibrio sp.]|uniref:lysophospholipid acyltransferase family protein n=1 Tax=Ferrovibrio sp. TaxID=1917215 RepID=UPI003513D0CA